MMDGLTEMTCRELVELVTEYLEATLPAPERTRFDAHLADCPYCATYLEQMRQTICAVGALREEHVSAVAKDDLLRVFRDWKQG